MPGMLRIVLAVSSLAVGAARAQNAPAVLFPDCHRLTVGADSLAIFVVRGADTTRTGTLWDKVTVTGVGAEALAVRVYVSTDQVLGSRLDTIVDRCSDLRPISHFSHSSQLAHRLRFDSDTVRGWLRLANGDSSSVNVAVAAPVYNSASFDLLLRSLDLLVGERLQVPSFLPTTRSVVDLSARVLRVDTIDNNPAWVVGADFTGLAVSFWIDQKTRRLVRQVMQLRPDMSILFARPAARRGAGRAT